MTVATLDHTTHPLGHVEPLALPYNGCVPLYGHVYKTTSSSGSSSNRGRYRVIVITQRGKPNTVSVSCFLYAIARLQPNKNSEM